MKPLLFGKYCLLERVSVGGMAEVFRAKPFDAPDFRGYLALKRILPHLAEDDEFIKMFIDEAKLTVQFNHPNIVRIYELGQFQQSYYILMEYISGKDVLALQKTMRRQRETIPIDMAMFVAKEIARGLHYAHHKRDPDGNPLNIIHRDVSPQNVLIDYRGRVKVIDFGIAKATIQSTRTAIGVLKGKMGYMSPEQVRGEVLDYRSDVFAIGTVLWEMLTNRRLFHGEGEFETMQKVRDAIADPPSMRNSFVPPEVDAIVMGALTRDPEARFESAGAMADAIDAWLAVHPFTTDDLSVWMRTIYADDLEEERTKRDEFATIVTPDDVLNLQEDPTDRKLPEVVLESKDLSEDSEAANEDWSRPELGEDVLGDPDATDAEANDWAEQAVEEGESIAEFADQHTSIAAGGFDAASSVVDDVEFDSVTADQPAPLLGYAAVTAPTPAVEHQEAPPVRVPMGLEPQHTASDFKSENTSAAPAPESGPPKILYVVAILSALLLIGGVVAAVGAAVVLDDPTPQPAPAPDVGAANVPPVEVVEPAGDPVGFIVLRLPDERDGMAVYVDGEPKALDDGKNPTFELGAGRHLLEVTQPGFRAWSLITSIEPRVRREELVSLVPATLEFEITASPQSSVRFDEQRLGRGVVTATDVDPAKLHKLSVSYRGQGVSNWSSYLGLAQIGTGAIEVDFDKPTPKTHRESDYGYLQVSTGDDWWGILLDGNETGLRTPIDVAHKLPMLPGKHQLTFVRAETKHEKEFEILRGETFILREKLDFTWDPAK